MKRDGERRNRWQELLLSRGYALGEVGERNRWQNKD